MGEGEQTRGLRNEGEKLRGEGMSRGRNMNGEKE